jgi:protocatechuate 3,4-dioxygenase beta subunit
LSAALAAAEISRGAASAVPIAQLAAGTVRGALRFATGSMPAGEVSPAAVALASDVIRGMTLARLATLAALLVATCLLATGFLAHKLAGSSSTEPAQADSSHLPSENGPVAAARVQAPPLATDLFNAPVAVHGRVLDPEGAPLPGAKVYVGYSIRPSSFTPSRPAETYTPRATSGADGRFRFTLLRSDLDAKMLDASRPAVLAVGKDYGPNWAVIADDAEDAELNLKLVRDLPLNGRILDPEGKPLAGARLRVESVLDTSADNMTRHLRGEEGPAIPWATWIGEFPGQPAAFTTDEDGRFHAPGFGQDREVGLFVEAPDIWHTFLVAVTRPPDAMPNPRDIFRATFDYKATPGRHIRGVVRDKATGNPVPGVRIFDPSSRPGAMTDKDGRYELLGCMKGEAYGLMAQPQNGLPYFAAYGWVMAKSGSDPVRLDFDLISGSTVHGRVLDGVTRRPPKTTVVEYYPLYANANSSLLQYGTGAASSTVTQPDGSYRLAVLPGPGIVCVAASPREIYSVAALESAELTKFLDDGKPSTNAPSTANDDRWVHTAITAIGAGGRGQLFLNRYHAVALIKPERTLESKSLDFNVQPARMLRGTVLGPDGKRLNGARVAGLIAAHESEVLDGSSFTIMGLNPRKSRELHLHHEELRLGKFLTLKGDEINSLNVQLVPCGTVIGRIVDKNEKPVPGAQVQLTRHADGYCLAEARMATDTDGRFRMESLVPGVKYTFVLWGPHRLRKDVGKLEVKSGQTTDLGELALDK